MKHLTDEELQYGIDRCKARILGAMPMGIMKPKQVIEALSEYQKELQQRISYRKTA